MTVNGMHASNAPIKTLSVAVDRGLRSYMIRVYRIMSLGLALTATVAWYSLQSGIYASLVQSGLIWVAILAPLGLAFAMGGFIHKMSVFVASMLFWIFAALMGLSLSSVFVMFTGTSIFRVLMITAIAFAGLSLYGYTTHRNLSAWGAFLVMGLLGVIVASVVNIFLASGVFNFMISLIGVVIFAGLTAYDTQRIRSLYLEMVRSVPSDQLTTLASKTSILGALSLYLNFVNMFILLLQIFGDRR